MDHHQGTCNSQSLAGTVKAGNIKEQEYKKGKSFSRSLEYERTFSCIYTVYILSTYNIDIKLSMILYHEYCSSELT